MIRSVFEATDSTRYPLQLRSQVVVHPPPRLQIMIKPYTYHTAYFPVYTYTCPLTDNRMCTSRARSVRTSTCVLRKVRCVPCACGNRGVDRRAAVRAPCGARADPRHTVTVNRIKDNVYDSLNSQSTCAMLARPRAAVRQPCDALCGAVRRPTYHIQRKHSRVNTKSNAAAPHATAQRRLYSVQTVVVLLLRCSCGMRW